VRIIACLLTSELEEVLNRCMSTPGCTARSDSERDKVLEPLEAATLCTLYYATTLFMHRTVLSTLDAKLWGLAHTRSDPLLNRRAECFHLIISLAHFSTLVFSLACIPTISKAVQNHKMSLFEQVLTHSFLPVREPDCSNECSDISCVQLELVSRIRTCTSTPAFPWRRNLNPGSFGY
jgi:hypothetical protein